MCPSLRYHRATDFEAKVDMTVGLKWKEFYFACVFLSISQDNVLKDIISYPPSRDMIFDTFLDQCVKYLLFYAFIGMVSC